jgi:hypothetical protein
MQTQEAKIKGHTRKYRRPGCSQRQDQGSFQRQSVREVGKKGKRCSEIKYEGFQMLRVLYYTIQGLSFV